ncbi:MAG: tetratricopeptide repeat protein [Lachnospiraceae bacterium]|nr:tetratricopeptide repeat protein [Lachnospiraceae bacterium]
MKRQKHMRINILVGLVVLLAAFAGCGKKSGMSSIEEGMQYIAAMDYRAALTAFDAAQADGEDERLIARGRGIAYIGLTDYEAAIEHLRLCLAASDGAVIEMDYDVNYYLAAAYQKVGQYAEAEQIYDAILALKPQETDAYYLRGNARLSQGQFEAAKEDFDMVIKLEPTNYGRLIQVYELLVSKGYREQGIEYLETALSERSAKMSAFDEGCINYYLGHYEEAQVLLEEAKKEGTADAYLYLGMAYEATGDYNYAITNVYTSYLNKGDGNAEIYNQLGLCYMKQAEYARALEAFQNAMQIPDNGMMQTLQFNEIIAYEYLGEYTQATVLLDNYLKTYPDDEAAQREYGFLSTR